MQVAHNEMVAHSPNLPADVKTDMELFDTFISGSHKITKTLLACLSDALQLTGTNRFEESHRDDQPNNTTLVLLHYPKNTQETNIGHNKHTDIGSITLLFTAQWGLQVFTPEAKEWAFIQPKPNGHAIINVGDSLRFLSGKRLHSCLHRVIPVNGRFQEEDRYSIAYFLRPESGVTYVDSDGRNVTAKQWHDEKYVMFAKSHSEQEASTMLTGGMEKIMVD